MTARTQQRAAACLLVGYVAFLGVVLGQADAGLADGAISATEEVLLDLGAPEALTDPGRIALILNVALFVPLAFLAALTMPRHPWANWVVYAFVASAGVEFAQGLILPARSAQYVDVVANTLGALGGATLARLATARRSHPSPSSGQ